MSRLTLVCLAAVALAGPSAGARAAGAEPACASLDASLQQAMGDTVIERGDAARLVVRAAPEAGAAPLISGGNGAYRRALQRALRSWRAQGCALDLSRPLVVRVVDPWGRGPDGERATAVAGR